MGQRSVPAPFLTKTYQLVDDEITDDIVSWGDNGTTFVVWNTAEFAKELLPNYFKHNNFSSFVRQLNTYGFRKIVPDKWEFANDNFKRGEESLLSLIRRRKTTTTTPPSTLAGKPTNNNTSQSQSQSGEEAGSTSTSSHGSVEIADISGENEKLRRDNKMLSSELAQTKKQCDELITFLTRHLNVGPEKVSEILRSGPSSVVYENGSDDWFVGNGNSNGNGNGNEDDDDNDDDNEGVGEDGDGVSVNERKKFEEEGLKLFGVWLKGVDGKKRGRCGEISNNNTHNLGLSGPDCGRKVSRIR